MQRVVAAEQNLGFHNHTTHRTFRVAGKRPNTAQGSILLYDAARRVCPTFLQRLCSCRQRYAVRTCLSERSSCTSLFLSGSLYAAQPLVCFLARLRVLQAVSGTSVGR
jgi:hypothetical protein